MKPDPRSHKELIQRLGGPVQLGRSLGMNGQLPTTLHWSSRGIPARYWHRVADLAWAAGMRTITPEALEQLPAQIESEAA